MNWISINDKLPPVNEIVIGKGKDGICQCIRDGHTLVDGSPGFWCGHSGGDDSFCVGFYGVTHWIPMPEE